MRKKSLLMLFLMVGLTSLSMAAGQIGVFANFNTNCIQYIDPVAQKSSESLLKGYLGSYAGGLLDVVITSDGKTAIVSNFGDQRLFFIDISRGFKEMPTLLDKNGTRIPIFAEDLELTPDDKYVLVTDGGFTPTISVVDVSTRKLVENRSFGSRYSNAVSICPFQGKDGSYIVMTADYFQGKVHVFKLKGTSLEFVRSFNVLPALPVNISISPDGYTAIAVSASTHTAPVFEIQDHSNVIREDEPGGYVLLPYIGAQSCVFSQDSRQAYYLSNSMVHPTNILVLDVSDPGSVKFSGKSIQVHPKRGISQLFGVDTVALDPSGNYLYVSNPTIPGNARISIVDVVSHQQIGYIQGYGMPAGIAFSPHED